MSYSSFFVASRYCNAPCFSLWCFAYGNGSLWLPSSDPLSLTLGAALLIGGQILNISVFYRLGKVGVFYGKKFGSPNALGAQVSVFVFNTHFLRFDDHLGFFPGDAFSQDDRQLAALETLYYVLILLSGAIIGNLRDPVQWYPRNACFRLRSPRPASVYESHARSTRRARRIWSAHPFERAWDS